MTSTLTFYQTDITPERNAVVDSLEYYLNHYCNRLVYNNFQYQKLAIDKTIKITYQQADHIKFPYNYVKIVNGDNTKPFYYFIIGSPKWLAQDTIELQISMDTVNTFRDDLIWTERTKITRQHFDRFIQATVSKTATTKLKRIVDDFEEGITPVKYLTSQTKLNEASAINTDWYLIYKNKETITTDTTVPIDCFCCASNTIEVNASLNNGINLDLLTDYTTTYIAANDNSAFTVNLFGNNYTISATGTYRAIVINKHEHNANADIYVLKNNGISSGDGYYNKTGTILTNISNTLYAHTLSSQITESQLTSYTTLLGFAALHTSTDFVVGNYPYLTKFEDVNRSDTNIVKIIKLPYAPFELTLTNNKLEVPTGWIFANGYFHLQDLNTEFLRTLTKQSTATQQIYSMTAAEANDLLNIHNDSKYESKLYNSNFYTLKYVYDNFEKEIPLERCTPTSTSTYVGIKFKPSNNLSSNSLFEFNGSGMTIREPQLYGQFMMVNRQNEVALYNSDYLNYIRTGLNYDKKALTLTTTSNIIGLGTNIAGAATSFLRAGTVGVATGISFGASAVGSLTNTITSAIRGEMQIKNKLEETKKAAASVSNTTDLNLLSYYNGNRLIKVIEEINPLIKGPIYNLFRLTGYACEEYMEPETNTRIWYNFIQCEPDFEEINWLYGQDILDDIKARYQIGITYFHNVNNNYDFSQEKENFERWIYE